MDFQDNLKYVPKLAEVDLRYGLAFFGNLQGGNYFIPYTNEVANSIELSLQLYNVAYYE